MKNYYDLPSPKRLEMIIKSKGISSRDLSKALYGQKTHRDVVVELSTKKDPRSSTIVRISRILQVPLDALFVDEEIPVNGGESALSGTDQGRLQLQDLEKQIEILSLVGGADGVSAAHGRSDPYEAGQQLLLLRRRHLRGHHWQARRHRHLL